MKKSFPHNSTFFLLPKLLKKQLHRFVSDSQSFLLLSLTKN